MNVFDLPYFLSTWWWSR